LLIFGMRCCCSARRRESRPVTRPRLDHFLPLFSCSPLCASSCCCLLLFCRRRSQPSFCGEYVLARGEDAVFSRMWTKDSDALNCQLCQERFTYSMRRHYCRVCGSLCCGTCSSKRLLLRPSLRGPPTSSPSPASSPPPSSPSSAPSSSSKSTHSAKTDAPGAAEERTCDGCFNRLVFESHSRSQLVQKARKEMDRQRQQEQAQEVKDPAVKESMLGIFQRPAATNTALLLNRPISHGGPTLAARIARVVRPQERWARNKGPFPASVLRKQRRR
jgi:hypothetical protein